MPIFVMCMSWRHSEAKRLGLWQWNVSWGHRDLQGLRRFSLATRDAHDLYRKFGFSELKKPQSQMEAVDHEIYERARS